MYCRIKKVSTIKPYSLDFIIWKVPSAQNKTSDTICTVLVTENGLNDASQQFTYSLASSPVLNSLSPLRGGTGGGTLLTISGTNFP